MTHDPEDRKFKSAYCLGPYKKTLENPHTKEFDLIAGRAVHTDEPVFLDKKNLIDRFGFDAPIDSLYMFPFTFSHEGKGSIVMVGPEKDKTSVRMLTIFSRQISNNL